MGDEEEEEIDEEQVEDYCTMLEKLGNFPEKVAINSLSMAAEDFASSPASASKIYKCIRDRLMDRSSPVMSSPDRKLPLVYVLDSLLKNVRGVYISIIQEDAASWMMSVYDIFDEAKKEEEKLRLKKVWNTWREFGVIKDEEQWRKIGKCFFDADEKKAKAATVAKNTSLRMGRNGDGTLQLSPPLRKQMQHLLDEVQSSGVDELDKVSLERLADINPDLLQQIKEGAEEAMAEQYKKQRSILHPQTNLNPSSLDALSLPKSDWSKLNLNHLEKSHDLIASLQRQVRSANETTVVRAQLSDTVHLYAAVSASAQLLTDMLQQWKDGKGLGFGGEDVGSGARRRRRRYSLVRSEKFTNEGIREHNDAVIAQLYEVGLPFLCSADGRRFATQLELSNHLDELFRRSRLEKTMETTKERGWYPVEGAWISGRYATIDAEVSCEGKPTGALNAAADTQATAETLALPRTVVADETRDRCVLCGVNFAMFFDQDDGEWKYRNCVERSFELDGPTMDENEADAVLVHVTCWEGLGCPEFLTVDQIRHAS